MLKSAVAKEILLNLQGAAQEECEKRVKLILGTCPSRNDRYKFLQMQEISHLYEMSALTNAWALKSLKRAAELARAIKDAIALGEPKESYAQKEEAEARLRKRAAQLLHISELSTTHAWKSGETEQKQALVDELEDRQEKLLLDLDAAKEFKVRKEEVEAELRKTIEAKNKVSREYEITAVAHLNEHGQVQVLQKKLAHWKERAELAEKNLQLVEQQNGLVKAEKERVGRVRRAFDNIINKVVPDVTPDNFLY